MYFFFSKVLLIFILPFSWIVTFFILFIIVKKPKLKRRFLIVTAVLLFLFSDTYIYNEFANHWDIDPVPLKTTGSYSCAIVLGGFSSANADGHGFFNGSADRFIQGLRLYNTGKVSHILISGGNGDLIKKNEFRESDWVRTQLQQMKVPDSCILIENRSRNTIENAAFSKVVLDKYHLKPPYVLVTSAFHMRRSLAIFKRTKIDVIPYSCNVMTGKASFSVDQLIPDANPLTGWNLYVKEVVGLSVYQFKK